MSVLGVEVQQRLVVCELLDDQPGPFILKNAIGGTTRDELRFHEHKFTYQNALNFTEETLKPGLELTMWRHENLYYPVCIKTLRGYLKKRMSQVKRKGKILFYRSGNVFLLSLMMIPFV